MEQDFPHVKFILYTQIHWSYTIVSEDRKLSLQSSINCPVASLWLFRVTASSAFAAEQQAPLHLVILKQSHYNPCPEKLT